jgi:transcriptional regulator with XRE-family HTH domain
LAREQRISVNSLLLQNGLSKKVVDNMKVGQMPSADKLAVIARALGTDVFDLLGMNAGQANSDISGRTFAERLKALRRRDGVTQEELAAEIGVNRSSVGKWENSPLAVPSDEVIVDIAAYFAVSVDFLLCYTDDPTDYENPDFIAEAYGGQYKSLLEAHDGDEVVAGRGWHEMKLAEADDAKQEEVLRSLAMEYSYAIPEEAIKRALYGVLDASADAHFAEVKRLVRLQRERPATG